MHAQAPFGPWWNATAKLQLITSPLGKAIGAQHNKSGAQVALRWIVQQGMPLVVRAERPDYIAQVR